MKEFLTGIKKKKKPFWILTITFLVFEGCFNFPLRLPDLTAVIDYNSLMIFLCSSVMVGIILAALIEKIRGFAVFFLTFLCTLIGMGCRYVLEFGEVSNTVNFTKINISLYLLSVPLLVTVVFFIIKLYINEQIK